MRHASKLLPEPPGDGTLTASNPVEGQDSLMALLIFGLIVFLGVHSVRIFGESGRERSIARVGEGPWKGVVTLLSLIGLVMIVWGFGEARSTAPILWSPPAWTRHAAILLMVFSLILLAAYGLKKSHIAVAVHHPMLWAVVLWSFAHLVANGSAADLVLFGAFLVWSLLDLASSYARDRAKNVVYPAPNWGATIGAIAVGIVLWLALLAGLHQWLFGLAPLAM
jgi:uncharacterized membrane protein